ncbi:Hypothetical protein NTJ_05143 [Nesidiocoris tenuis]|uniref:MYST-type HAT domain-containing protein n=1 Tax=Nesidiocoris tenuis TaxID=355587 RepID=A0ABN7AJA2_9HEMI|nr:Hypothetical protein NTJ_05143 [Nesidiocoris tenuis]
MFWDDLRGRAAWASPDQRPTNTEEIEAAVWGRRSSGAGAGSGDSADPTTPAEEGDDSSPRITLDDLPWCYHTEISSFHLCLACDMFYSASRFT